MAAISQTAFSNAFSWMKRFVFWFKLHWRLFLGSNWQYGSIHSGNGLAPNRRINVSGLWNTNVDIPDVVCALQRRHRRHNGRDGISNDRRLDCLLNSLFRRRSKKASQLRVFGLCDGNSPGSGEFPAQRASNAESVSNWWRHHAHCITDVL